MTLPYANTGGVNGDGPTSGTIEPVAEQDWEDDDSWQDFIPPDGVYHSMIADDAGNLSCCGRNVHSLPAGDWQTADPQRVTCEGSVAS